jgi:hypothetical protein
MPRLVGSRPLAEGLRLTALCAFGSDLNTFEHPRLLVAQTTRTYGRAYVVVGVAPLAVNPARGCDSVSSEAGLTSGLTSGALCGGCDAVDVAAIGGVGGGLSALCMRQQAAETYCRMWACQQCGEVWECHGWWAAGLLT